MPQFSKESTRCMSSTYRLNQTQNLFLIFLFFTFSIHRSSLSLSLCPKTKVTLQPHKFPHAIVTDFTLAFTLTHKPHHDILIPPSISNDPSPMPPLPTNPLLPMSPFYRLYFLLLEILVKLRI